MTQLQSCGSETEPTADSAQAVIEATLFRSLRVGQWVALCVVLGYMSYAFAAKMPLSGVSTLITALFLAASIWAARCEGGFERAGSLLLGGLWFGVSMTAFSDGMSKSKGLYLLSLIPCIAAHLRGGKSGIRWGVLCVATIVVVVVTDIFVDLPREYPAFNDLEWVIRRCIGVALFAVLADMQVQRARGIAWQQAWQSVALDRASAVAVRASRSKSEFLARVSHEIRTPMHGVLGMTQQLSEAKLSQSDKDCLLAIERCAESLQSLLNDGLELSARQGRGVRVDRIRFSLDDIVHDIMMLFSAQAQMSQTPLSHRAAEHRLWAWGDPKRTRQVLSNLVGNALKFGAGKPVEIAVTSFFDPNRGDLVEVSVRDHGIGIRAEDQEKLFLAYKQLDASGAAPVAGTGLGLAISMELAQQMKGSLSVESELGRGSCFSLRLAKADANQRPSSQDSGFSAGLEPGHCLQGKSVLVVDDNEVNRRVASLFLRSWGAKVQEAKDGQVACDKASHTKFDLILMDLQMPVMGGIEATKAIRASGVNVETAIFALTANAFAEDKARCVAAGMDGHLAKPFKKGELLDLCSSHFGATKVQDIEQVA